ncbi:MAG: ABC transporter ATP-binding protein/permease [Ruminococcaceae bacterium]|nr:ABC transporter ATP-binding protein/permease [Oscillospiraceae bacterium]
MLRLKNIRKTYTVGDSSVQALDGVSIDFRPHEFVSILGPSGCGKTTMLNIIGGLDQYTSGDLVISGRSTKEFRDSDWDTYRNHSIGFVFQSYNLIPHQTVLSNVELALTLSGVSKAERRRRAIAALERVGLGDQLKKKPNQMSGGQMQRVAIARALVNDPEILLADEPTGALDSETSVQIMDILREISAEKLIIMVTHNPDLAKEYSSRIIRLLDGRIIGDTAPYNADEQAPTANTAAASVKRSKKPSMSFGTALSLSMNNLMTKRGRTILTSFAGSIGIIGIALILSISTGVQAYIDRVQEDTLSSYPITLQAETVDMTSLVTSLMNVTPAQNESDSDAGDPDADYDRVYTSPILYDLMNAVNNVDTNVNNLSAFREHLETNEAFDEVLSTVKYNYAVDMNIYTENPDGDIILCDTEKLIADVYAMPDEQQQGMSAMMNNSGAFASMNTWSEMLPGNDGALISDIFETQYDLVYGTWPQNYNEVVLFISSRNEVSDLTLYTLGLKTSEEVREIMEAAFYAEDIATDNLASWSYEEICQKEFRLLLTADQYQKNTDGTFHDLTSTQTGLDILFDSEKAIPLKIVGIARPDPDAVASMISDGIGYTTALTRHVIEASDDTELVKAQLENPDIDAISGLPFKTEEAENMPAAEKTERVKEYFASLPSAEKAALYTEIASTPTEEFLNDAASQYLASMDRASLEQMMISAYAEETGMTDTAAIEDYIAKMDDETLFAYAADGAKAQAAAQYAAGVQAQLGALPTDQLAAMLETTPFTEEQYVTFFETYLPAVWSESTYEDNLKKIGYITIDKPSSILLYASTFEDKDAIADLISAYNDSVAEEDKIEYTDYVALMMSSITTVINAISYVLIAFVAISLVVSSIMIGIITYISVLERTKEIGILRAIGASKRDISRVFNAETLIVGFGAGAIGIGVTLLLIIPINAIVHYLTDIMILNAYLPPVAAVILVGISMFLTFIAGLIPSGVAAKKDPVEALRSE